MTAPRPWLIAAALLLAAPGGPVRAAEPGNYSPTGYELFQGLLAYHEVVPARGALPAIVVVFNPPDASGSAAATCRQVLEAGGSVLLAADRPTDWTPYFPPRTSSAQTTNSAPLNYSASRNWARQPRCPLAEGRTPTPRDTIDIALNRAQLGEWGLFAGLTVATNAPATVVVTRPGPYLARRLAEFPPRTIDGNTDRLLPPESLLAVGGSGPGPDGFRVLLMADPSVFSNQMLTAVDGRRPADNGQFANNVVTWLTADGTRKTCLFVADGNPVTRFDQVKYAAVPEVTPPPIDIDPLDPKLQKSLTDFGNQAVDRLQTNDVPNKQIVGDSDLNGLMFGRAARRLAAAAGVFGLVLLATAAWRTRHRPANRTPDTPAAPAGVDYTGPVTTYLIDLFAAAGRMPTAGRPPRLAGPAAGTLGPDIRILWEVAAGTDARPVTAERWRELRPLIEAVEGGHRAGRWRFRDTQGRDE